MFGRSSAPRFKDKVDSTPGPGDYNAQAVSASSKRGPSMGIGARTLHTPASEFAHLGPGFYSLDGEPSFGDHARRGAVLRAGALDYAAALKKLAASFSAVMGPAAGPPGAAHRELSREEICSLAGKLVAESTAVCSDVVRIKGELDGINSRVKDEVNAALKPSKATGSAGNPSAWKIYTPLEKALEHTSGDLAKKLAKLSSFLAALHEGFPALAVALADGDRIGQLSQMVDMLEANLEAVQKQAAESAAAAESACEENQALQRELAGYKRLHMQQQVRADKLEALLASQKEIVHTLEEQIEASHAQQDALWSQLLAQDGSDSAEPCADFSHQDLFEECKESRDAHAQTLQELHALQLQMTEVLVQNEHEKALLEEQLLAESDSASSAANEMLSEIDECRALLMQSHRDKRIIRGTVSAMEASRRALRSCLAAGAQELCTLHADLAEGDVLQLSMASPQMLRPEAKEAVSQLDRSLTDDLLASQTKVEELTEALNSTEQQLLDSQLELTKLQEETAARSADAHSQDLHLTETIEGLMHSHHEAEQHLRAELLAQEEIVRDLQEQLLLLRQRHDEKMECINDLNTSLANLTSQFQNFADATSVQQEQLLASAVEAQTRHAAAMETALKVHCQERAAHEAKLAQTIAKYEQDLSDKALEVDTLAEQVAQVVVAFEGTRSAQESELASLADRLKQEIAVKDQLQATKMLHEDTIATLQSELQATKDQLSATQADLSETQGELERTTCDLESQLAASQEQVAQLMETKSQHEDVIARLEGELQSAKEQLTTTQDVLGRSQEEVAQLTETKAQHEEIIATLQSELQATKDQLSATQADLSETQGELERTTCDLESQLAASQEQVSQLMETKSQHEDVIARLEGELQSAKEQLTTTQDTLGRSQEEVAQLTETKAQHEEIIATLQSELGATKDQLSATQADLSETQGELERTTCDLESQLAASQEQVAQLMETKSQHEDVIARLEGELQSAKEQLTTTQDTLGRSQEEVAQLTETKAQHEEIIAQQKGELHATKDQLSATQADLSETRGELERTIRDLQGELAVKVESIGVLEQQLAVTQSKLDLSKRELERALDTLTATAERLQEEALQVAADMQAVHQSNLNKMQTALRQQHAEAESKLAHAAEKQAQVQESLEGELAAHERTTEDLSRTKQELELTTCDLQGQIAASQQEVAQLAVTKAQHEEMIAQLHSELGATKEQLAQTQEELERTTFDLQGQLASSQEEVAQLIMTKAQHLDSIAQLAAQLDAIKQLLSQAESDLEASAQLEKELRQSLAETEAALQDARAEARNLGEQLEQVSDHLARVSADRDDKAQRVDLLSAHALELSNNLQDERTQRQAESERAAEKAEAAAQHLHAAEIAHKEAEVAQDERIAKLDACVGYMETEVRESKMLMRDMTTRIDARASNLMSQLQHSDADLSEHKQKLEDALQQLSDAREAHEAEVKKLLHDQALTLEEMQAQHTQNVNDWQSKLSEAQEQHAAELSELRRWASEAREAASVEHEQAMEQQRAHSDAVKAQLSDKVQQVQQHASELTRSLEAARADLSKTNQEAQTAREDAERELAAAQSKIDMLRSALKGTEQEKAQALAAISNMYVHTDQQLKAMAGAGAPHSADAGSIARIATLQVHVCNPPPRAFVSLAPCRRTRILLAFT
jgi:chromosome segregation ATPase